MMKYNNHAMMKIPHGAVRRCSRRATATSTGITDGATKFTHNSTTDTFGPE